MRTRSCWHVFLLLLALLVLVSCEGAGVADTEGLLVASGASSSQRLDNALGRVRDGSVSEDAAKEVKRHGGFVLVDVPARSKGWPAETEVRPLFGDPALRELLDGMDEAAAAKALWTSGARTVALHWRARGSVDRTSQVIARLYHHGDLNHFSLVRVTDELLIYRVLEQPVAFPPTFAAACLQYIRALQAGESPPPIGEMKAREGDWEFIVSGRVQGRELTFGMTRNRLLSDAMKELSDDLERTHRRWAEWYGFPPFKEHLEDLTLEIHRITERAIVDTTDEEDLENLWELGVDGAIIRDFKNKKAAFFPGSVAFSRSITSTDSLLRNAAQYHHLDEKRPWRGKETRLEMIRDIHYREIKGKGLQALYRGVPPEPLPFVNLESIKQAILLNGEWYLANLKENGQVTYKWWPSENRDSNEYNHVRHALATWNLTFAYRLDPRPEFLEGAQRSQDWTNKALRFEEDRAFYTYADNQKLGSVVVALMGMIDLARLKDDHSNDELMKKLGNFTKFMQEPSGKFKGYYVEEDHPYADFENDIVPGEAALALIMLADYFKDPSWLEPLKKYWEYYMPWYRSRAAKKNPNAPWPAYVYENDTRLELVQFGPWTVMAANAYHEATGDQEVARFGLDIARWMIETYQYTPDRALFPDYVGGYYKLPHELPAMQAFCYAEGTATAYALALRAFPEEAPFFEKNTRTAVRFAFTMQYDDWSTYPFSRPWFVRGGIRYAMNETKVRVDYVHHAMSAMWHYYNAAIKDPNLPEEVRRDLKPPNGFISNEALVAALPSSAPLAPRSDAGKKE